MSEQNFTKYQAIGNDFLVIETGDADAFSIDQAIALCDRHFGIGGDGVLLVSAPTEDKDAAVARMVVINADGSRPEMCGNGLRCVALHLSRTRSDLPAEYVVQTDAGPRHCQVELTGGIATVTTSMGKARQEESVSHDVEGKSESFDRINMGNPHAIVFRSRISNQSLDVVGPALSGKLEGGSNIEVAEVQADGTIVVDVWERGVGRTLACGTGAAATAFSAVLAGHAQRNTPICIRLPGGPLELVVADDDEVVLKGPAALVFAGTTNL